MKHDHKKTKKLKVTLFSIVMLLPCLAVGITCLTHVFNKEIAEDTQTATINYQYETNNPQTELIQDNVYLLNTTLTYYDIVNNENDNFDIEIIQNNIQFNEGLNIDDTSLGQLYEIKAPKITITIEFEVITINYTIDNNRNQYIQFGLNTTNTTFTFNNTLVKITPLNSYRESAIYTNLQELPNNLNPIESVTINTITQDHTTNIFYDSCTQVQQSFILNWCNTNNPISQPIINFTNVFSLPNDHIINTLLTYWFSISMIYIVIDIIIECIVYITHFFNKEQ